MSPQTLFLSVNVLGGLAVISSYLIGLWYFPEHRNELWGGIQDNWKNVLVLSMLLAAAGYMTFCYFAVFREGANILGKFMFLGPHTISWLTALFLVSAAVWMPASIFYLHTGNGLWWVATVAVLWITALTLITLTVVVAFSDNQATPMLDRISCTIGLSLITTHCLFVDAIIWVVFFHRKGDLNV